MRSRGSAFTIAPIDRNAKTNPAALKDEVSIVTRPSQYLHVTRSARPAVRSHGATAIATSHLPIAPTFSARVPASARAMRY